MTTGVICSFRPQVGGLCPSGDLYYNTFNGTSWLDQGIKISKDGKTKTDNKPALAAYNGKLYMVAASYKC